MTETLSILLTSLENEERGEKPKPPLDVFFDLPCIDWDMNEQREVFEKHYREIYWAFLLRELPECSEYSDGKKEELLDKFVAGINYFNNGRGYYQLDRWRYFRERYDNHKEDELIRKYAGEI
jgi:hypothetical protein